MTVEEGTIEGIGERYQAHLRQVEERRNRLNQELKTSLTGISKIVLEIGCGHGHWLTDFAAAHEDRFCMGIDLIGNRIERAKRKVGRAGLKNACFLKAEATELLEQLPRGVGIQSVFVLFPDPWPKKRHWKNRIMNPDFLDRLSDRCVKGAKLHFRTDHTEYFEWASKVTASAEKWKRASDASWPFERETVFQSKADSFQSFILEKQ